LSVFSYGMFITLTVGFILCIVWVLVNLFAHIVTKR
jgi:flagellar biosynthesis protein FliR